MTQAANLAALGTNASSTGILPAAGGGTAGTAGVSGFKNRIINGAMTINQRSFSGTVTVDGGYTLDRWQSYSVNTSKYSVSQNAGSVTTPAGFINYLGVTSLAATSVGASDYYFLRQTIEGNNMADFGWGTANAKTVTLSFQVYSSLTGTFGGALQNNSQNRSYPFTYTISSANTWISISITIPGDTSGTWLTNTSAGILVQIGLGVGSTFSGASGSWSGSNYYSATGGTQVVATNGATFYITGIQLEVGTTATNFDVRSYGTELQLCQRYYQIFNGFVANAGAYTDRVITSFPFPVAMRASPSVGQTGVITIVAPGVDVWQQTSTGLSGAGTSSGYQLTLLNFSGLTTYRTYPQAINYAGNGYVITLSSEI